MPPSKRLRRTLPARIAKLKVHAPTSGFLQLPPEIRNDIYSRLLVLDRYEDTRYYLDTSILRVNKQIHAEASKIMRWKNCWVLLTLEKGLYNALFLNPFPNECSEPAFLKQLPKTKASTFKSAQKHAIQVSVHSDPNARKHKYLVSPFALSKIWRWFPHKNFTGELIATLTLPSPHIKIDSLLSSLVEFRGFHRVDFNGPWPHQWVHQIQPMLTQSSKTADDLLEIMSSYRSRALHQLELGDTPNARSTFSEAYDCIVSWDIEHVIGYPHFTPGENGDQFYECRLQIILNHASLTARFGCADTAGVILNKTFKNLRLWPTKARWGEEIAEAHFLMGFAYIRMGFYNAAVYFFMETLNLERGHVKADEELDKLELHLKLSNDPKNGIFRRNIEQKAESFRHRERQGSLTEQDYEGQYKFGKKLPFEMLKNCKNSVHRVRYPVPNILD